MTSVHSEAAAEAAAATPASTLTEEERVELARIEQFINNPPVGSKVHTITPAMAAYLLDKFNTGNRTRKPSKIRQYARDMKNGEWRHTGDTLKFSVEDRLRDGQNRLYACVLAEVPFQTHIVYGIEDDTFDVLDQGKVRNPGDVLFIAGYQNTTVLGGAIRWAELFRTDTVQTRKTFEPKELLAMMQGRYEDEGIAESVTQAMRVARTITEPAGFLAGFYHTIKQVEPGKAALFIKNIDDGHYKPPMEQVKKIRDKFADVKKHGRVHDVFRAGLWVMAWNYYVTGKLAKKPNLKWDIGASFPDFLNAKGEPWDGTAE